MAPGAKLLVGKVLDNTGSGQASWIIAGMEWAANSGAKIVSMSLGGTASGPSDVLSETVDELSASTGALFVIAAGNAGPGEQTVGTPGIADSALTVGAVDKSDQLASFSSRGPRLGDYAVKPEITAPGVSITAARAAGTTMPGGTPVDDYYTTASGTSMATPHVAGAAALVVQAHPDWTGEQIKEALASTAKTNTVNSVFEQGDGRVDAVRAVEQDVFATSALSFGRFEDGDNGVVGKDITYTNTTDSPVELKLSSSIASLALGADSVTVPARGTAGVSVGVDRAQGGRRPVHRPCHGDRRRRRPGHHGRRFREVAEDVRPQGVARGPGGQPVRRGLALHAPGAERRLPQRVRFPRHRLDLAECRPDLLDRDLDPGPGRRWPGCGYLDRRQPRDQGRRRHRRGARRPQGGGDQAEGEGGLRVPGLQHQLVPPPGRPVPGVSPTARASGPTTSIVAPTQQATVGTLDFLRQVPPVRTGLDGERHRFAEDVAVLALLLPDVRRLPV
ncbi:S8 family peptidase [Streptomyces sp. L7]